MLGGGVKVVEDDPAGDGVGVPVGDPVGDAVLEPLEAGETVNDVLADGVTEPEGVG